MPKPKHAREDDDSFWLEDETLLVREEPEIKPVYDLEERTARFGEAIIDFARTIPRGPTTDRIISQLIGAGTSVGANYVEADDSVSKKEFLKCIGTCKKEARETKHFLRMAVRGAAAKIRSAQTVARSQRTASDLCQDLAERKKSITKSARETYAAPISRHSSFRFPSSFVISH